jgi:hypothetical protein
MLGLWHQSETGSQVRNILNQMFNAKLNKFEFVSIAMEFQELLGIPIKSREKRRLNLILDWFVRNWTVISPYLPFVVSIRPDGTVVEMEMAE